MYNKNHCSLEILTADEAGFPIYSAAVPRNRMEFLLVSTSFGNKKEQVEKWREDRFAAVRPICELFKSSLSKYIIPSPYLLTDKTIYSMRHQIAFRQNNPSYRHQYGPFNE